MLGDFFVSTDELWTKLAIEPSVRVFDVRRRKALDTSSRFIPGARWRNHETATSWCQRIAEETLTVVVCIHGHNVSQSAASQLRAAGRNARVLSGGIEGWIAAQLPTIGHCDLSPVGCEEQGVWVTSLAPSIDQIACAWLIRRFIDPEARILFADRDWAVDVAVEMGGVAFGFPGAPVEQAGEHCCFDVLLKRYSMNDPGLVKFANIVRDASIGRGDGAPETAGVLAATRGASMLASSDAEKIDRCSNLYDAVYARLRHSGDHVQGWELTQS